MPKKPIYIQTRYGRLRKWVDIREIQGASTEELRAWLWQNDSNGDYDGASRKDMVYLIIWIDHENGGSISPGPKKNWPQWFADVWGK